MLLSLSRKINLITISLFFLISNGYAQKLTVRNNTKNFDIQVNQLETTYLISKKRITISGEKLDKSLKKIEPKNSGTQDYRDSGTWIGWVGQPFPHHVTLSIWPHGAAADSENKKSKEIPLQQGSSVWDISALTKLNIKVSEVDKQTSMGFYTYYNYVIDIDPITTAESDKVNNEYLKYFKFNDNLVKVLNKSSFQIKAIVNKMPIEISPNSEISLPVKDDEPSFDFKIIYPDFQSQNHEISLGSVKKNLQGKYIFPSQAVDSDSRTIASYKIEGSMTPNYILNYETPDSSKVEYKAEIAINTTPRKDIIGVPENQIDYSKNTLTFYNKSDDTLSVTVLNGQPKILEPRQKGSLSIAGDEWLSFLISVKTPENDFSKAAKFEEGVISKKIKSRLGFDRPIPDSSTLIHVDVEPVLFEKSKKPPLNGINYDISVSVKK